MDKVKAIITLDEELTKQVVEITDVDYTGELELKDIENMIKDLIVEYHRLEEKIEDKGINWEPDPYKEWRDNRN